MTVELHSPHVLALLAAGLGCNLLLAERTFVRKDFAAGDSLGAQAAFFRKDIPVADRPSTVVIGDFNGDAKPDMMVGSGLELPSC